MYIVVERHGFCMECMGCMLLDTLSKRRKERKWNPRWDKQSSHGLCMQILSIYIALKMAYSKKHCVGNNDLNVKNGGLMIF